MPAPAPGTLGRRLKARAPGILWPVLIVASVLVVLHGFWLHPRLTNQQVDLMSFWLPRWCFLGRSLEAGHLPTWLPNQFGGVPFASDPQSGWTYLPPMVLFSLFSCARALGLMVVLNPIVAGLGVYGFGRNEGLGRPAATVGGLTIALGMAGSSTVLSLPFAGTLAWTAVALAGASGYLRSRRPWAMIGWLALTGLAWWQIAGAHLTHGLLSGSTVLVLYVGARSVSQVRSGERTARAAAVAAGALVFALPLLAAASLVPRLALLPRTSIGHGYRELATLATRLSGVPQAPPLAVGGVDPWWITAFARAPGGYVGAVAILLAPASLLSRRWRAPAAAFAAVAVFGYVLNLDLLVASEPVRRVALATGLGELWLRAPIRFQYPVLLAFAAMAAFGLQSWIDGRGPPGGNPGARELRWLAPGLLLFVVLPVVAGARLSPYAHLAVGLLYAVPLLLLALRRPGPALPMLAVLLALELTVAGLVAQAGGPPVGRESRLQPVTGDLASPALPTFRRPFIDPVDYLTPGPIGQALIDARSAHSRYLSFDPELAMQIPRAFLFRQQPEDWPQHENGRSILFGLEEVQGYSPVQADRYWRLVRRLSDAPVHYNTAAFQTLEPSVLRLFGVGWLIMRAGEVPPAGATRAATEGRFVLYRLSDAQPRASLVHSWEVLPAGEALEAVVEEGFDPALRAVVEDPTAPPAWPAPLPGPTAAVSYSERSPGDVRVHVRSDRPGLLVVRNVHDDNWRATVDGRPARLFRTDYLLQGVFLPAGTHEVRLIYADGAIGAGLAAGATAWIGLVVTGAWLTRRARGRQKVAPGLGAADVPISSDRIHAHPTEAT